MPERAECIDAELALQRAVVGALPPDELEEALAHIGSCPLCNRRFELASLRASMGERDTVSAMAERPVDSTQLFERAYTRALSERDAIARRRAAEWFGDSEELGPAALGALVKAAARDRDESVRESALAALERLGHVALLLKDDVSALNRLSVRGETGAFGEIERRDDQWWMKLNRLPDTFEQAKPVVAIPGALETRKSHIDWSGEIPGVVVADEHVAEGALELFLGTVAETASARAEAKLFSHVYLLNPRKPRRDV